MKFPIYYTLAFINILSERKELSLPCDFKIAAMKHKLCSETSLLKQCFSGKFIGSSTYFGCDQYIHRNYYACASIIKPQMLTDVIWCPVTDGVVMTRMSPIFQN